MTKEYHALSNEQKLRLMEICGARGHQPNKRQCMDRNKSLKSQVAAIAHQLSALQSVETSREAAEGQDGRNTVTNNLNQGNGHATRNHDHLALTRQG